MCHNVSQGICLAMDCISSRSVTQISKEHEISSEDVFNLRSQVPPAALEVDPLQLQPFGRNWCCASTSVLRLRNLTHTPFCGKHSRQFGLNKSKLVLDNRCRLTAPFSAGLLHHLHSSEIARGVEQESVTHCRS